MPRKTALPSIDEIRTNLRRTQILDAAIEVFAKKGYHRATTKDIARAAKIAEGTIYLYFKNKAELLMALVEYLDQATTQAQDLDADLSLRDLLTKRLEDDLAQLGSNFDLLLAIMPEVLADSTLRPQFYKRIIQPALTSLIEHLEFRQEQGEVHVKNIPMTTRIFLATMLGMELLYILGDKDVQDAWKNPAKLAEYMAAVLFDGLQQKDG